MNLVSIFRDFKRIYGFCPCCQKLFRLSDTALFTRHAPPRTDFERLDMEWRKVEDKWRRLEDRRATLQKEACVEGRIAAQKRLRLFQPFFSRQRLNVKDVKVLFDPVDYLAFRGLDDGDCKELVFIDREPDSNRRERLHKSLRRAIDGGNLEWKTVRIADDCTITLK
jgi:predicted Holliday junction resolvase-like endonuclease